jgi:tetratricopeptide (TPR) repeat protein
MSASRVQEAKLQFQRALQIDPSFTDARYDLASAEAAAEEWEAAAAEFERVLTERPADAMARQHLGEVLMLWGDQLAGAGSFEEAVKRYEGAIPIRVDDAELRTNFGNALVRLGRLNDARAQFQAALRLQPGSLEARKALEALDAQQRGKPK